MYLSKFLINWRPGYYTCLRRSIIFVKSINNFWNLHGRIMYLLYEPWITRELREYECSIRWIPITTNRSASSLVYILTGIPRKAVRRPVKPLMPRLSTSIRHIAILLASTYINCIRCRYLNNPSSRINAVHSGFTSRVNASSRCTQCFVTLCFNKMSKTIFIERDCC